MASEQRKAVVVASLAAAALLTLAWSDHAASPWLLAVDDAGHGWALTHRTDGSVRVARVVTLLGEAALAVPVVALVATCAGGAGRGLRRRASRAAVVVGVLLTGLVLRIGLAHVVARPRPPVQHWRGGASGSGFPSGHTTVAALSVLLLLWLLAPWWRGRSRWLRVAAPGGLLALAVAVGWSRIWLGVHWPLDVVGSWLFALTWLAGCWPVLSGSRRTGPGRTAQ